MTVVLCTLHALGWAKSHETNVTGLFLPAAAQFERPLEPVQAALDAGLEFFQVRLLLPHSLSFSLTLTRKPSRANKSSPKQDRVILPPEMQAMLPDYGITASTMALLMHLTAMTQRLPLRILQVSFDLTAEEAPKGGES